MSVERELYCLDTSVLIESWQRHYRPTSFPSFWEKMEDEIIKGRLIVPEIVLDELKKKTDDLYEWAKERDKLFKPLNSSVQQIHIKIINQFQKLIDESKNRSMCDPWVISLAQFHECPVVTEEGKGSQKRPKIPDVCNILNIECIRIADLIENLKWRF